MSEDVKDIWYGVALTFGGLFAVVGVVQFLADYGWSGIGMVALLLLSLLFAMWTGVRRTR